MRWMDVKERLRATLPSPTADTTRDLLIAGYDQKTTDAFARARRESPSILPAPIPVSVESFLASTPTTTRAALDFARYAHARLATVETKTVRADPLSLFLVFLGNRDPQSAPGVHTIRRFPGVEPALDRAIAQISSLQDAREVLTFLTSLPVNDVKIWDMLFSYPGRVMRSFVAKSHDAAEILDLVDLSSQLQSAGKRGWRTDFDAIQIALERALRLATDAGSVPLLRRIADASEGAEKVNRWGDGPGKWLQQLRTTINQRSSDMAQSADCT